MRVVLIILLILFSEPLCAVDVSQFDIKGIKLGMSKSEVLKRMPCNNPENYIDKLDNGTIYSYHLQCRKDKGLSNDFYTIIDFDHNGISYSITKMIPYKLKPNYTAIIKKIIKKYGNPTAKTNQTPASNNYRNIGYYKTFCWGDCRVAKVNMQGWKGTEIGKIKNIQLRVNIHNMKYKGSNYQSNDYSFKFILEDPVRYQRNTSWKDKIQESYQRKKASDMRV